MDKFWNRVASTETRTRHANFGAALGLDIKPAEADPFLKATLRNVSPTEKEQETWQQELYEPSAT